MSFAWTHPFDRGMRVAAITARNGEDDVWSEAYLPYEDEPPRAFGCSPCETARDLVTLRVLARAAAVENDRYSVGIPWSAP